MESDCEPKINVSAFFIFPVFDLAMLWHRSVEDFKKIFARPVLPQRPTHLIVEQTTLAYFSFKINGLLHLIAIH